MSASRRVPGGGVPGSWAALPCPALQRNVPIPTPEHAVLCSDAQPPVEQTASAGASFDLYVAGDCDGTMVLGVCELNVVG